jgi:predicted metalloprotease with PDZ domain
VGEWFVDCLTPWRGSIFVRAWFTVALLSVGAGVQGEIEYRVKVDPASKRVEVEVTAPSEGGPVSVQIPNWMPGHYVLDYYWKNIHDVTAADSKGKALALDHPNDNTWTATSSSGIVSFRYWVPIGAYRRFAQPNENSFVQLAGAVHYMYVVGRKGEPCKVTYDLPKGWPALTALDRSGRTPNSFVAPNYDTLADNPLSTGDVLVDHYRLRGKDMTIVIEGLGRNEVDRARLLRYCKFVSTAEGDFFHGTPYHRYVWHFIVLPSTGIGGGGLEHLSSTQINFSSRLTPATAGLLAHEHFHLWNVKRIRPKVLGPFDYINLPQTGALWWSEGVTDYYASLLPYRYGALPEDRLFSAIAQNTRQLKSSPGRLEVSPYQSSYRLNESSSARGGTGSNGGYKLSFYTAGFLCGFCLDSEIRYQSKGKHSLDDVMRALFDECKNDQPGFAEDEIRNQCIRFGGPTLGAFYDQVVMSAGEMPIEAQLAKLGLQLNQVKRQIPNYGFITAPDGTGAALVKSSGGAAKDLIQVGDKITAVDGVSASGSDPFKLFDGLNDYGYEGHSAPISLTVVRGNQTLNVTLAPSTRESEVWEIAKDPNASKEAVALREGWLKVSKLSIRL